MSYTNLPSFLDKFDSLSKRELHHADNAMKTSLEKLKDVVVALTPVGNPALWKRKGRVDPHPGQLKASWTIVYNIDTFQLGAMASEQTFYATLQNEVEYAHVVEYGSSTQAPNGMLRISLKQFPELILGAFNSVSSDKKADFGITSTQNTNALSVSSYTKAEGSKGRNAYNNK